MAPLLTAHDVAERLGVTVDWVWAAARDGRIPHIKLGRYRRFREETLEAWIRDLERGVHVRRAIAHRQPRSSNRPDWSRKATVPLGWLDPSADSRQSSSCVLGTSAWPHIGDTAIAMDDDEQLLGLGARDCRSSPT